MPISAGDFRKGVVFEMDGKPMLVVDFQHVKPGKGAAFVRTKYKNVMTRVAWLAPEMWAELFLENKDFLMAELDTLMANLRQYQDAMVHNDLPGLVRLLDEGRKRKEEVDGR